MESKTINATEFGPEILLDATCKKIRISGKSRMEDAMAYYQPVHEWLAELLTQGITPITIELDLSYFNSSSAKQLLKILMVVDSSEIEGKVRWIYPANNDTLLERGNELEVMVDLVFEYVQKNIL